MMGFVSYREDILDRFYQDLVNPAQELLQSMGSQEEFAWCKDRLHEFVETCHSMYADMRGALELATDPTVDLARQNLELEKQIADWKARFNQLKVDRTPVVNELKSEIERLRAVLKDCNLAFAEERNKHDETRRQLSRSQKKLKVIKGEVRPKRGGTHNRRSRR